MKTSAFLRCFTVALALAAARPLFPAEPSPAPPAPAAAAKPKTFLIILRLTPKFHDQKAWTDADNAVVGAHFNRLKDGVAAGQVILAGRTDEAPEKTQGLIIFTATDEAAARDFMNADPCIVAGIMTGTLHPYSLALLKKS